MDIFLEDLLIKIINIEDETEYQLQHQHLNLLKYYFLGIRVVEVLLDYRQLGT
jgi:hypothetical protein